LAYVQHHGFADFAEGAGPGVLELLRRGGVTSGHVLDLGCGDGGFLRALIRKGLRASGIEQSPSLARYARNAAPDATVLAGSIHRVAFPRCDAVTALGEVLCYLPNSGRAPASLRRIVRRAYTALRPGGLFVFDLLVPGPKMDY